MDIPADRPTKAFSCVRCFERKVKCDKQHPCSGCVRSKAECVFRVPAAPRRKKKRPQEEILLAKLKQYEELLQSKGINVDEIQSSSTVTSGAGSSSQPTVPSFSAETELPGSHTDYYTHPKGKLIMDQGRSLFIENNLWTSVSEEFQQVKEAIVDSDSEDAEDGYVDEAIESMLGYTPSSNSVQHLHPPPDLIFKLWQLFLENVNPMTKVVHQPTLQVSIAQASGALESIPKGLEALMFSIYSSAVFSVSDDECQMTFGESRRTLLSRYRHGTRKALARAKFLGTTDIVVLQAFVIYLLTMREDYDSRTLWTLTGVASRIAQGMGLHRDGEELSLPPFETEIRRRLWWQISILDFRSAELTGSHRFGDFSLSDTKVPTNVNDEDLYPGMTEPPVPHTRPTEMITCLLRCEFGAFWKEKLIAKGLTRDFRRAPDFRGLSGMFMSLEERDRNVSELEQRLEEKFLRYCDPSIPLQFMTSIIGRSAVNSMRLMAHHPRRYAKYEDVPEEERHLLWTLGLKLLESDNLAHSSRGLQRYMWHSNVYFQWQALIHILGELRTHTLGDEVDKAWRLVDEVFEHHRNFVTDNKKPLHVAVGSLCLKAYTAREQALRENSGGTLPSRVPEYITLLRKQRAVLKKGTAVPSTTRPLQAEMASPQDAPVNQTATLDAMTMPAASDYDPPALAAQTQMQQQQQQQHPRQLQQQQQPVVPLPFMATFDPSLAQDFMNTDIPMDWLQWDYLLQDLDAAEEQQFQRM